MYYFSILFLSVSIDSRMHNWNKNKQTNKNYKTKLPQSHFNITMLFISTYVKQDIDIR